MKEKSKFDLINEQLDALEMEIAETRKDLSSAESKALRNRLTSIIPNTSMMNVFVVLVMYSSILALFFISHASLNLRLWKSNISAALLFSTTAPGLTVENQVYFFEEQMKLLLNQVIAARNTLWISLVILLVTVSLTVLILKIKRNKK